MSFDATMALIRHTEITAFVGLARTQTVVINRSGLTFGVIKGICLWKSNQQSTGLVTILAAENAVNGRAIHRGPCELHSVYIVAVSSVCRSVLPV